MRQGPNKISFNSVKALNGQGICLQSILVLIPIDIYHSKDVQKSKAYKPMHPASGVCNVHSAIDKSVHRRKRKVISQGLSDQCMRSVEPMILSHIDVFLQKIMASTNRDRLENDWSMAMNLTQCFRHLTFDIMADFSFGQSLNLQNNDDNHFLFDLLTVTNYRMAIYSQSPSLAKLNLEKLLYPNLVQTRRRYIKMMTDIVNTRLMGKANSRHDLHTFLADAKDPETGEGFTNAELWSESRFILAAGEESV